MDCCGNVPEVNAVVLTAWAAFGIGITTSLGHCIGMCGPLISTFSLAQGRTDKRFANLAPALLLYHLGRVNSYAVIGLVFGLLAAAAKAAIPSATVRGALFLVSGLMMVFLGLGLLGVVRTTRLVESSRLGRFAAERFMELIGTRSMVGRYLLGVANGFLPCGPVYAVAAAALTAPTPLHGAGTMAMFGLGTIPVLLAVGLGAGRLAPTMQRRFNRTAAILVIIVGLEFLFRAGKFFGLIKAIKWGFLPIW
ncbi:MAG TPA: sulfite exporter TauE/SafE family protein [Candidatus Krumholzibacteria bacterium]|nr:sulfite exporter TauE/SafE family protein [Candidatus Krumholzibacteria bacterium]